MNPNWIINCAAFTNVDGAERDRDSAFKINYLAPKAFSEALYETGGKLLQLSTDFVFDGKETNPYKVTNKTNPLNIYGKSKMKGEEAIQKILEKKQAKILRTSWVISPVGSNFVLTMLKLHNTKKIIKVVSNQIGSPTSSFNLAEVCWQIILKSESSSNKLSNYDSQIFHFCNEGETTWYELSKSVGIIGEKLGLIKEKAELIPIKASEYKSPAVRPKYSVLDSSLTLKLLDLKPVHWHTALIKILEKLK